MEVFLFPVVKTKVFGSSTPSNNNLGGWLINNQILTNKKENKMKAENKFRWPKEIYIFWLVEFILGIELIGPVLLIFFKDWGGLNQTQTQVLQSWFTLWIFILEIPTGVFGDVKGKKYSVILGYILMSIGTMVYSIIPNLYLFFLAEFLFALGIAFISGAKEAWMYDIAKELKVEERFRDICVTGSNLHMLGMIVASVIFIPVSNILPVHHIFRVGIISRVISLLLLGLFVRNTDGKKERSLKPEYIETAKKGLSLIKNNLNLRKITIYLSILTSTSYFVIWLYQEALKVLDVGNELFGIYRVVLLVAEIVAIRVVAMFIKKYGLRRMSPIMAVVVAVGFLIAGFLQSILGILILLIFAGGLGLQIYNLLSKEINEEIDSEQRATALSFVSMVKRLMLTLFNPAIGYLVDSKGVFIAFTILGVMSLLAGFFKPKYKLK
jgi:MFS family permease